MILIFLSFYFSYLLTFVSGGFLTMLRNSNANLSGKFVTPTAFNSEFSWRILNIMFENYQLVKNGTPIATRRLDNNFYQHPMSERLVCEEICFRLQLVLGTCTTFSTVRHRNQTTAFTYNTVFVNGFTYRPKVYWCAVTYPHHGKYVTLAIMDGPMVPGDEKRVYFVAWLKNDDHLHLVDYVEFDVPKTKLKIFGSVHARELQLDVEKKISKFVKLKI